VELFNGKTQNSALNEYFPKIWGINIPETEKPGWKFSFWGGGTHPRGWWG